ncbi:MAG: tRNA glutamyl-Q(34) synthetase GluQRS [Pseudomonadota bacterium]
MASVLFDDGTATPPVFRFAPSPNGLLHLGHALSALVNFELCQAHGGRFLLRMEDIDIVRCTPAFEDAIFEDLAWLGVAWDEPVRRQSVHFDDYAEALDTLRDAGLIYPATLSRAALKRAISAAEADGEEWPRDPDGAPLYPTDERHRPQTEQQIIASGEEPFAWRLNVDAALAHLGIASVYWPTFNSETDELLEAKGDPTVWGDVILARRETPTSYHLSVVMDDAVQGVSHVVRGRDLEPATAIHRVIQMLLGLPCPSYHHHDLVLADDGRKLSKSQDDTSLASLRASGLTPDDIRRMVGLSPV